MPDYSKLSEKLSIVIPLLNEHESITELYNRIMCELGLMACDYEIIFIDDGSNDGSFDIISKLRNSNDCVKGIRLRRNFGKSIALNEGFRRVSGDIVITMDADLQDDPSEIPRLVERLNEGYDLVSGWKKIRKDSIISKNIPSKIFNKVVRLATGLELHDFNCGLKAYRRAVVEKLYLYGEMHRFVPALVHAQGYKVTEIPVKHHSRRFGVSKFGLARFTHGFFDFITVGFLIKFLKRPMHFFGGLGALISMIGFVFCVYLTVLWFAGEVIGNRPLLILGVLLIIVGMQLVTTGLVAEMLNFNNRKRDNSEVTEELLGF